ncbi:hypothetical protein [Arthrobacter sp. ISL-30]|uniref:hypothetical protein n=1 Tax=Arthrobacter sp. ISL-30 TaxID=2819109 RepID=UPI001BE54E7D|nr:hypothetical protein [Arthrobacter sp. ISL-30]MBT2514857.1 hypothetical protein [Arthrobacter sp. ISL-30]
MNGTPRTLNRILIGTLGVILIAIGLLLLMLATIPAVASWWQGWSGGAWARTQELLAQTRFPGRSESWLWIVVAVVLALIIGAMVAWVAQQGKGRANDLVVDTDDGDAEGTVVIGGGVAEQALKAALADRQDLAGVSVATYDVKGRPGLRIRIEPRQGVEPQVLAAEISRLIEALDAVIGKRTPVLVHIASGARAKLTRAERVR